MKPLLMHIAFAILKVFVLFFLIISLCMFLIIAHPSVIIPLIILYSILRVLYVMITHRQPTREDILQALDDVSWRSTNEIKVILSRQKCFVNHVPRLLHALEIECRIERHWRYRSTGTPLHIVTGTDKFRRKSEDEKLHIPHSAPIPFEPAPIGY